MSLLRDTEWFPKYGAIIDFTQIIRYIESKPSLDIVSEYMGIHAFIEESSWTVLHRGSSEECRIFIDEAAADAMDMSGVDVDQFLNDMEVYQAYRDRYISSKLRKAMVSDYNETGFRIRCWLTPTQAVMESYTGNLYDKDPAAKRTPRYEMLGSYLGS